MIFLFKNRENAKLDFYNNVESVKKMGEFENRFWENQDKHHY